MKNLNGSHKRALQLTGVEYGIKEILEKIMRQIYSLYPEKHPCKIEHESQRILEDVDRIGT